MRNVPVRRRAVAGLALAATLLVPRLGHGQRLQTYVGDDREPVALVSGPSVPVADFDAFYDPARVDIGTNVRLPHDKKFYGVTAIAVQETGDEPCKVELYGRLLDPSAPSESVLVGAWTLFGCDAQRTDSWRAATLVAQPRQHS